MRDKRYNIWVALAIVPLVAVPLYFLLRAIYALPPAASVEAQEVIDPLMQGHFVMIAALFALIMVIMLYAVVVFRRRPGEEGEGTYIHGITWLEYTWTLAPLILVVIFGWWGVSGLAQITSTENDDTAIDVLAIGQQWAWVFQYGDAEGASGAELVLPVGEPVLLRMTSRDVLHSFWVPEFRVKQDLLPEKETVLRFTPSVEGEYKVRCAEICGLSHAYMLADVRVVSRAEYDDYLDVISDLPDPDDFAGWGELHYQAYGCAGCHSLDGSELVGPSWQGIWMRESVMSDGTVVVSDEEYIRNSILNPNLQLVEGYAANLMPQNYGEQFAQDPSGRDIVRDLTEFMKTLSTEPNAQ